MGSFIRSAKVLVLGSLCCFLILASASPTSDGSEKLSEGDSDKASPEVEAQPGPVKPKQISSDTIKTIIDTASNVATFAQGIFKMTAGETKSETGQTIGSILDVISSILNALRTQFCRLFSGLFKGGASGGTPCGGSAIPSKPDVIPSEDYNLKNESSKLIQSSDVTD